MARTLCQDTTLVVPQVAKITGLLAPAVHLVGHFAQIQAFFSRSLPMRSISLKGGKIHRTSPSFHGLQSPDV
jgi:hypothetical protein